MISIIAEEPAPSPKTGLPVLERHVGEPFAVPRSRPSLGLIGVGAFGALCIPHLTPFFDVRLYDATRNLDALCACHGVDAVDLATAAGQDIVVVAVPKSALRSVARAIAPHLRPESLVIDVCSLKTEPLTILASELPPHVGIVGTHPLFGPQSGRDGIEGLRIAICPARGRRARLVERFLRHRLKLRVVRTSAEEHDRQMAYVQGLTHLLARIVVAMGVPRLDHTTAAFSHLEAMVGMLRHDSDELFRTIVADNPFAGEMLASFAKATDEVMRRVASPSEGDAA